MSKKKTIKKMAETEIQLCDFCEEEKKLPISVDFYHAGSYTDDSEFQHYYFCSWDCFDKSKEIVTEGSPTDLSWWDQIEVEVDEAEEEVKNEFIRKLFSTN